MEKEQYVSLETSQLLKCKGFDWAVLTCYENSEFRYVNLWNWNKFGASTLCSAPTQQMAMRWLREENGIHPELELCTDNEFSFTIYKLDGKRTVLYEESHCWTKSEDAVEAALQYVLTNLI